MTDRVLAAVGWLEFLKVFRRQDFQEKSVTERKTGFQ
jgi:hypothetical protein